MTMSHRRRAARSASTDPQRNATDGILSDLPNSAGTLTRRSLLAAGAGLALAPGAAASARAEGHGASRSGTVPLGCAIQAEYLDVDPAYRNAAVEYFDLIMPMNELKFGQIRPTRDSWNFEPADRLVEFALSHGRSTRGTCHVWWNSTPEWVDRIETAREAEAALIEHIERVGDRYRGRLIGWDVVNEVIANNPLSEGPLRRTAWLKKLGPRHIPIAFEATARADPDARLVINDYDLEFAGPRYDARREVMLTIVRQLQDRNLAVTGVGIQGHLYADRTIDKDALERFHRTLDGLGVGLLVTELDVIDWESVPGAEPQDATAHRLVADLLDGVFAFQAPESVIVWGVSDRYSWVSDVLPRPDGHPSRPLPLDRDMSPKRWMRLLRQRLRSS